MEIVKISVKNYIQNLRDNENELMVKPFQYMHEHHMTEAVSVLVVALNQWMNIPEEKMNKVLEICKLMRDSAILIDDIQDDSLARDGVPVVHKVFGSPSTIAAANFGYFLAMKKAAELGHPDAVKVCYENMMNFHIGQGTEIYWRDNGIRPTEEEYKKMVLAKTCSFALLASRLLALFSENTKNFDEFSLLLGYYMQVKNDHCNLMCTICSGKQIFCEDFTEGKFSFPITHAINQTGVEADQVYDIVKQKTTDNELKKVCLNAMDKLGSLTYSGKTVTSLYEKLCMMITELGPNAPMSDMLYEYHKCQLVL